MDWDLFPGSHIRRTEVHDRFGGSKQNGISPSARSDNILVFSDPARGEKHGYFDRWTSDGVFLYTGEGKRGDQRLVKGNKALLEHRATNRHVRLFNGAAGTIEYLGEYEIDPIHPYFVDDAPESESTTIRKVIVFRLRPVDVAPEPAPDVVAPTVPVVTAVAVQQNHAESWVTVPSSQPTTAQATEQLLVLALKAHLEIQGCTVVRHRYQTGQQASPLYCDVFNETRGQLIEAKGSVTRGDIRMAIGQLLDYRHLEISRPEIAVLLPELPRLDLLALLDDLGIAVITPNNGGFVDNADGRFV